MSDVECQLLFGWHFDFTGEHTLSKGAAHVISEDLSDAAELVDETGHTGVRCADHWPTRFDAAKDCIRQMLMRASGSLKPPVVRDIHEKIRTGIRLV